MKDFKNVAITLGCMAVGMLMFGEGEIKTYITTAIGFVAGWLLGATKKETK
mgnify:FL=1